MQPVGFVDDNALASYHASVKKYKQSKQKVKKKRDPVLWEEVTAAVDMKSFIEPVMNDYSNYRNKNEAINYFGLERDTSNDQEIDKLDDEAYISVGCQNTKVDIRFRRYMSAANEIVPAVNVVIEKEGDNNDDDDDSSSSSSSSSSSDYDNRGCEKEDNAYSSSVNDLMTSQAKRSKTNKGDAVISKKDNSIAYKDAGGKSRKTLKGVAWKNNEFPSAEEPKISFINDEKLKLTIEALQYLKPDEFHSGREVDFFHNVLRYICKHEDSKTKQAWNEFYEEYIPAKVSTEEEDLEPGLKEGESQNSKKKGRKKVTRTGYPAGTAASYEQDKNSNRNSNILFKLAFNARALRKQSAEREKDSKMILAPQLGTGSSAVPIVPIMNTVNTINYPGHSGKAERAATQQINDGTYITKQLAEMKQLKEEQDKKQIEDEEKAQKREADNTEKKQKREADNILKKQQREADNIQKKHKREADNIQKKQREAAAPKKAAGKKDAAPKEAAVIKIAGKLSKQQKDEEDAMMKGEMPRTFDKDEEVTYTSKRGGEEKVKIHYHDRNTGKYQIVSFDNGMGSIIKNISPSRLRPLDSSSSSK
jgi:hypothetical protein